MNHPKEDHNQREFKSYIIDRILDLPKKNSTTREALIISSPHLKITAPILKLLKIWRKLIVASTCGSLARIEKQAISLKLDLMKRFSEKHPCKRSTIKDQKSNNSILLDLQKRSSKIRGNFVNDQKLNMMNTLWCNDGPSEKFLYRTCWKLSAFIEN